MAKRKQERKATQKVVDRNKGLQSQIVAKARERKASEGHQKLEPQRARLGNIGGHQNLEPQRARLGNIGWRQI